MKTQKLIYIVGGSVAGITVAYFIYDIIKTKRQKKLGTLSGGKNITLKPSDNNSTNIDNELGLSNGSNQVMEGQYRFDGYIRVGDKGQRVYVLQSALNILGASLTLDGKWGANSYDAFNKYADEWWSCNLGYGCKVTPSEYDSVIEKAKKFNWNLSEAQKNSKLIWSSMSGF